MTPYELDTALQLAKHQPPCRQCEHRMVEDHDMNSAEGACRLCDCAGYKFKLCLELTSERLPCAKPLGHDGVHYFPGLS
jgi:hypothetical protein